MCQRSHGTRFEFEALAEILAFGDVFGQNLNGDETIETGVTSLVHFAHAAGAKRREDFVRSDLVSCKERHIWWIQSSPKKQATRR